MSNTYKVIEVVGSSEKSIDLAIKNAIKTSGESVKNLDWFEVKEIRGHINKGDVAHFQVVVKIGFRFDKKAKG